MSFVTAEDFTHTKVLIKAPKLKKDKSGKSNIQCYILYEYDSGVGPLYLKTPMGIRSPFGFSKYEKPNGDYDYSMPLSERCLWDGENEVVKKFFVELQKFDEMMIEYGIKHSKLILNKQYTEKQSGIVEAMYTKCVSIKQDKDGNDYPPQISPKFLKDYETGKPTIELYVNSDEKMPELSWGVMEQNLTRNCSVTGLLQPKVWIVNGRYGCKMQYVSSLFVVLQKRMSRPSGFIFQETMKKVSEAAPVKTKSVPEDEESASASVDEEAENSEETDEIEDEEDAEE